MCIDIAGNYTYTVSCSGSSSTIYSFIKSTKSGVLVDGVTFGFNHPGVNNRLWLYGFKNTINGVQTKPLNDNAGYMLKQFHSAGHPEVVPVTIPLSIYTSGRLSIDAILQCFDAAYPGSNLKYCINYRMV